MKRKQAIRLGLGFVVAILFVWLIVRQINLAELKQAFTGTHIELVGLAVAVFFIGYSCRIERWRSMLSRERQALRWVDCAGPFLASFAANNVLPFRAGDVLRAFAFNARLNTNSGTVLATLFVERLLDLLMVLMQFGAALAFFGGDVSVFVGFGSMALVSLAIALLVLLMYPKILAPIAHAFGKLVAKIFPAFGSKLVDEIDNGISTLSRLACGNKMLRLIGWSFAAWMAEGCVFWLAALAVPALSNATASWLALPVGTLATLIPSTPGYIGTFDYFTVRAMTTMSNSQAAAAAYALLIHALLWFPPTVTGGLYLMLHPVRKIVSKEELL